MKKFNRSVLLFSAVVMLVVCLSFAQVNAADDEAPIFTFSVERSYEGSFTAEGSSVGEMVFFGAAEFDGCYGNQLSSVAGELYDSMVKQYAIDKKTGEYTHTFETELTFDAEISGNSIVENEDYEEVCLIIDYAMQASMDAFLYDHPEVFWFRNLRSSYSIYATGNSAAGYTGVIDSITIIPTEIYSGASAKISQYDAAVNSALSYITSTESRYDTVKNIHDYICNRAIYKSSGEHKVHSSEPFFIGDGGVVCEGYAKSFKVICDRYDIPCVLVSGYAGGAHMWNYVQMDDGKWYLVDATWDDQESKIYYTYFLANKKTVGFDGVTISNERTERNDFSGTGIFTFTYPVLSDTVYTVHEHKWENNYTIDSSPSCTTQGSKSKHCSVSGCTAKTSVTVVAALGHTGGTANCTDKAKCSRCGNAYGTVNVNNHKSVTILKAVASTCTKEGKTEGKKCTACGVVTLAQKSVAKKAHTIVTLKAVAATCTEEGLTEGKKCTVCDTVTVKQNTAPLLGHTGGTANCTDKAKCSRCGNAYGSVNVNNHKSVTILKAVASTCTKEGKTEGKKCTACGVVTLAQKSVAKKAHIYKNIITKASLTKNGKIEKKCVSCGKISKTTIVYCPKTIRLSKTSYIYNGKVQTPTVTVKDSKGNTLKKDTDYTVKYESGRKATGTYSVTITFKGKYSGKKTLTYTIAPKATGKITATRTTDTITLKWNKVTGATGYRVYQYNSKTKKWISIKTLAGTTYKCSKLKAGTGYKFRIKAYKNDDGTIWGAAKDITTATKPAAPKITKLTATKGKAVLVWSDVTGETGYEVYASTKKDTGYKKVAAVKADVTKVTAAKLTSGKTCYFKVRAYKTAEDVKIYSGWSEIKSVKVK